MTSKEKSKLPGVEGEEGAIPKRAIILMWRLLIPGISQQEVSEPLREIPDRPQPEAI